VEIFATWFVVLFAVFKDHSKLFSPERCFPLQEADDAVTLASGHVALVNSQLERLYDWILKLYLCCLFDSFI
jgi:hypothetical protein